MNRRTVLLSGVGLALAGCGGSLPTLPVKVELPAELTQLIDDAMAIVGKLDSLKGLLPAGAIGLLDKGKALVASIAGSSTMETVKGLVAELAPLVQQLAGLLPAAGSVGTVVSAIETVLPVIVKLAGLAAPLLAARRPTGMTVEQARMVLRS